MIVKKNGVKQRSDLTLTKEIATTLREMVLAGESLYQKGGKINLFSKDGEKIALSVGTLNAWILRRNIVPGIGVSLKDYLDKTRVERRVIKMRKQQEEMWEKGQNNLEKALSMRTNLPVFNKFGQVVRDEDGNIVRRENPNLLKIQLDAAKFVLERLNSENYGKRTKIKDKHLAFSLADFRREAKKYEEE